MSDEGRVNLSLGEPPKGLKSKDRGVKGLLGVILLVQIAVLAYLVISRPVLNSNGQPKVAEDHAAFLKNVAMTLEDKSLYAPAADRWEQYLEEVHDSGEKPQILYRIGKLRMKSGDFGPAVAAFVRAEKLAPKESDLPKKIGPKMVDCLRKLGLYGEVGRELSRRVEVGGENKTGDRVLATLAGESITESDLDRMIERRADQMLSLQGGSGAQRAQMIQEMKKPERLQQLFQELLQVELFSRRARELKLDQKEDFLEAKELLEQNLLQSFFLREKLEKIQPTEVDLNSYYSANKESYKDEESGEIPEYEAVRERVYQDYSQRKSQELMQGVFQDLMARYDLKLRTPPGAPKPEQAKPKEKEEESS